MGMSPRNGTFEVDEVTLSRIRPPMTMVWRSFTITVVLAERLLVLGPTMFGLSPGVCNHIGNFLIDLKADIVV